MNTAVRIGMRAAVASALASLGLLPLAVAPASADPAGDAPASWQNERILSCDGQEVVTYLTPGGFGTPYHVVGSTDLIVPKHVEVAFPDDETGTPVVTLDVPGFKTTHPSAVHCSYVDPAGLFVDLWGLRV